MSDFFVYEDLTLEEVPRCYYVGKGDKRRVHLQYRNQLHENIKRKYGCDRWIVFESTDESTTFGKERQLIAEHKTYVYGEGYMFGANFTEGGEGCSGRKNSLETRELMGLGRLGKTHTAEARAKMSKARKGRKLADEHRENIRKAGTGRLHSEEIRARLSELARLQHSRRRGVQTEIE